MKFEELMDPPPEIAKQRELFNRLNDLLGKCGLGLLNIDEFWKSYLFQKNMLKTLEI